MTYETVREAVGVFHEAASLQAAADELMIAGFDRAELSLLAGHEAIEEKLGHMYEKATEIEDDAEAPVMAYIGPDSRTEAKSALVGGLAYVGAVAAAGAIVASGGTVAAAILTAAAAGGTGGLVGAVLARLVDRNHARYLQVQLDRGGLLLWVRTRDKEHEQRACAIMRRHAGDDVHVHDLPKTQYSFAGGVSHDMSFMERLGM